MSGGRSQDDGEERLTPGAQRILDVASDLFYWRGINAVGVDTIAAESGVTKRTLYDRFGSKERLVAAYLRTRDRRWRQLIATRLEDEDLDLMQREGTSCLPIVLVNGEELGHGVYPRREELALAAGLVAGASKIKPRIRMSADKCCTPGSECC